MKVSEIFLLILRRLFFHVIFLVFSFSSNKWRNRFQVKILKGKSYCIFGFGCPESSITKSVLNIKFLHHYHQSLFLRWGNGIKWRMFFFFFWLRKEPCYNKLVVGLYAVVVLISTVCVSNSQQYFFSTKRNNLPEYWLKYQEIEEKKNLHLISSLNIQCALFVLILHMALNHTHWETREAHDLILVFFFCVYLCVHWMCISVYASWCVCVCVQ